MAKSDDLRLGSLFVNENESSKSNKKIKIALIGYACDEGVSRNGGRIGAAAGPEVVRNILKKKGCVINEEYNISLEDVEIKHFGDSMGGKELKSIHKDHQHLVERALKEGYIPIVIGGGNDQSYPNFLALHNHINDTSHNYGNLNLLVVNIDAHLDVRPLLADDEPHSGSPFRQILETKMNMPLDFVEFGVQGSQCSSSHVQYVNSKGGDIFWLKDLHGSVLNDAALVKTVADIFDGVLHRNVFSHSFVSFDIDSIRSGDCPGVSCPSPMGLSAEEALAICYQAGRCDHVSLMDVSEFNPAAESYRTGTLVANMIYFFIMGVVIRMKNQATRE